MKYYYFAFYIVSFAIRKLNKKHAVPSFASIAFLSIMIGINILSIVDVLNLNGVIRRWGGFEHIFILLALLFLNHFFIIPEKKGDRIMRIYDKKYKDRGFPRRCVAIIVMYFLVSILISVYTSNVIRSQNLRVNKVDVARHL